MRIKEEAKFSVLPDGLTVVPEVEGERLLAVAILADAIQLLTEGPDETLDYRHAWFWLFDSRRDVKDRYIYAFHSICALVQLDHVAVRERVWRMVLKRFPRGPLISLPDWHKTRGRYVSLVEQYQQRHKDAKRDVKGGKKEPVTRVSRRQVTSLSLGIGIGVSL